jgi:hypothetical protein
VQTTFPSTKLSIVLSVSPLVSVWAGRLTCKAELPPYTPGIPRGKPESLAFRLDGIPRKALGSHLSSARYSARVTVGGPTTMLSPCTRRSDSPVDGPLVASSGSQGDYLRVQVSKHQPEKSTGFNRLSGSLRGGAFAELSTGLRYFLDIQARSGLSYLMDVAT